MKTIKESLKNNSYAGRGIMLGHLGNKAVLAYFIMGRSENSRNRIFVKTDDGIVIKPYDISKVTDPSLIIYSPVRRIGSKVIVTNGDQTDTVYDFLVKGSTFGQALATRCFEPDAPNFTPRISGIIDVVSGAYTLSILKSSDKNGTGCNRYYFDYCQNENVGRLIHTYNHDGNPLPSFEGEPREIKLEGDIDTLTQEIWDSLDEANRISLYVEFFDKTSVDYRLINKNK